MKPKIKSGKTRLLLVEGKAEKEFFIQLGNHLQFPDDVSLQIIVYEGKDNLRQFVGYIQQESYFLSVTHIGIVRDADFDKRAFEDIQNALDHANTLNPDRPQFPEITETHIVFGNKPKVSVFIMPNANDDGMLESLLIEALANDKIMACVDEYFICLEKNNITPKPEPLPKAQMRVYMTALYQGKMRAYIEGKNVDVETVGSDKDKSYLSDIYKMTWWDWNHPVFDEIKIFIKQLVELPDSQEH
ncbi:MAG: DUF3226 domain-containing protein [Phototrophicaceae bacterium]